MNALPPNATDPWTRFSRRRRIGFLVILSLVATSNFVDRNVLAILLEPIKHEFDVSDAALGLLSGLCFALFYATLGVPIARWADRGNRPQIINAALIIWSVMTALCGCASTFWQLALTRVGVGAGEAGAVPPAQSLIADYFPPAERARALSVYTLASTAGYLFGFSVGGWIAQRYGWRATFIAVGFPGLLLSLLVRLLLREPRLIPPLGMAPAREIESIGKTLHVLIRKRAFIYVLCSMILYYFLAYGAFIFTTPFIVRVHGLSLSRAGAIFGAVAAAAAVLGSLLGGSIADKVIKRDVRSMTTLCALGLLTALPLHLVAFLTNSLPSMFVCLFIAIAVLSGVVPSQYAALHMVCGSRRRATAIALALLCINLVGMGIGPILTGLLSDYFALRLGAAEGLRYALIVVLVIFVPCAALMWAAGPHMQKDIEA